MVEKTSTLENFEHKHIVWCKVVKTYVEVTLCLEGGPMKADGPCRYFVELEKDKDGNVLSLIHAVPTQEAIVKAIVKEK